MAAAAAAAATISAPGVGAAIPTAGRHGGMHRDDVAITPVDNDGNDSSEKGGSGKKGGSTDDDGFVQFV